MEEDFDQKRTDLVKHLVRCGYISKPEVIESMGSIPRHLFVPENIRKYAYEDHPLEIGQNQTISAPHMVGIMIENLDLMKGHRVLEIGTGLGYHSAVASKIVGESGSVHTIERYKELADKAKQNFEILGIKNVFVHVGDGSKGFAEHAPYDRIFATCGAPSIPSSLIEQLKKSGKLIIPVGERFYQDLILAEKVNHQIRTKNLGGCMFVPMVGEYGFK